MVSRIVKALVAAGAAGVGVVGGVFADGEITVQEWGTVASAVVVGFLGAYAASAASDRRAQKRASKEADAVEEG